MSEYDDDLLKEGIQRVRAKEFTSARSYLERALDAADDLHTRMQAFFYLSEITSDPVEKRKYLEEVLAIDLHHLQARRALAILDGRLKVEEIVNPDALPQSAPDGAKVVVDRFTCPKCGGRMAFTADGQSLLCEFCQRSQVLTQSPGSGQDFLIGMATIKGHSKPSATRVFKCRGCGADFILPARVVSATCAYCASNHVVVLEGSRDLLAPDAIIPMAFDRRQAALRLVEWVEANRLEPQEKVQPPFGLYLPVWVFEAGGTIPWNGSQYKNKQQVAVSGSHGIHYPDLVVPATHKLAGLAQKVIAGFNFGAASAFDLRYLAGWPAEIYEMSMSAAALEARRMAGERLRSDIALGEGDVRDLRYSPADIAIVSFQLVLVPVWMTTMRVNGREVRVVINGQCGTVHGEA